MRLTSLELITRLALSHRGMGREIDRLAWAFYGGPHPGYVPSAADQERAGMRCLDWAIFVARPTGHTIAERVVAGFAPALGELLPEAREVVQTRTGMFRVTAVQPEAAIRVRDMTTRESLLVRERIGTRQVRKGGAICGLLHRVQAGEHALAGSVSYFDSAPPGRIPPLEDPSAFMPLMERHIFGAGEDWVQDAPADLARDVYSAFRRDVNATGEKLPTLKRLMSAINRARMPSDVFALLDVAWYSEHEFGFMAALVMRLWNTTPRDELGGRAPVEVARQP